MSEHRVRTKPHYVTRPKTQGRYWYAECVCGWFGQYRVNPKAADDDGQQHLKDQGEEGSDDG